MNCNTTHYRANSSSVPGDPTLVDKAASFIRYERHMDVLRELHGQSLLVSEGAAWQKQRRMLAPSFNPKRFDSYSVQVAEAAASVLDELPAATVIDFEHAMNMLTMDVVLRTMFGSRIGQDISKIEAAVHDLSLMAHEDMFKQFSWPDWLPLPGKARKREAMRVLVNLIDSHIAARRAVPVQEGDLLDTLLAARDDEGDGSALSDRQVRDQLMTIFFAGHETTASGLTWASWLLASQPEAARRAQAEVDAQLGGRVPTYADVARLPYLNNFVKETLRLFSPAPGVFLRRTKEQVQIGQWTIPQGALVAICTFVPHYDARWFPEPERFDPERFEGEAGKQIPRGAYIPFGTGPRVCIGVSFASMEMALILAMLLQRFVLTPAPGQTQPGIQQQVTVRPAGGLRVVLERRAMQAAAAAPAAASGCPFHGAL